MSTSSTNFGIFTSPFIRPDIYTQTVSNDITTDVTMPQKRKFKGSRKPPSNPKEKEPSTKDIEIPYRDAKASPCEAVFEKSV
ncbi:uncharacterized protein CTRU02_200800 [Colletotrichum truncatum]|uniref:Uncharacterized protein n=1 Tax=Colletotrichum truncatum TaxID=5467 RepID=A0ACC3ZFJ2_COLTU